MRLYYVCKSCKKENNFSTKATNRYDLQMERNDTMMEVCTNCRTTNAVSINSVYAKPNYLLVYITLGLFALITILFYNSGIIAGITFFVPLAIWQSEKSRAHHFNKLKI